MLGMLNYKSTLYNKTFYLLVVGVQTFVLKNQPLALYTYCFSHELNLSISKACKILAIRIMFGIIGSVSVFLSSSEKKNTQISVIFNDSTESSPNKIKLKALCATP